MSEHYLTRSIVGTGGKIKETIDDFFVEEIPLYLPAGDGEHLYITVEKKNLTTHQLLRQAARIYDLPERDIGYAGLKDAKATTIQTISLPLVDPDQAEKLANEQIKVLAAKRHRNKLRTGHLLGNRFRIRIADPTPGAISLARQSLDILSAKGVPNYFGAQRYGALGNSHQIGQAILQQEFDQACRLIIGDPDKIEHPDWKQAAELFRDNNLAEALNLLPRHCRYERTLLAALSRGKNPRKALFDLPRNILRLYLSAYQSSLFDRIVDMRLTTLDKIWPGDIAYKHLNGACFRAEDNTIEQPRADRFEISATAPLYGHKTMLATGQSGLLEEALLEKEKLQLSDFKLGRGLAMSGERRPLRVPVTDVEIEDEGESLLLTFSLPKGSYATSLLREVIKGG